MPYCKIAAKALKKLTSEDKLALKSIYLHRCLTAEQISEFIYQPHGYSEKRIRGRMEVLQREGVIELIEYRQAARAVFLTTLGVSAVVSIYGEELNGRYRAGNSAARLPLAHDLKINPANIRHQLYLNSFALRFERYAGDLLSYQYYDAKFMPRASFFMMPDGMIELPDRYVFLEMDMGTERAHRLKQKWNSYRVFLSSTRTRYQNKPILLLFILEGMTDVQRRRKNVIRHLMSHISDLVQEDFEVYVDTPESLHRIIQSKVLGVDTPECEASEAVKNALIEYHGWSILGSCVSPDQDLAYDFYIKKHSGCGSAGIRNSQAQEFFLDLWMDGRLTVLKKYLHFSQRQELLQARLGRKIPYIVVLPSESEAFTLLKMVGKGQPEGLYFTTLGRLQSRSWPEAIFGIDQLSNQIHYTDETLKYPVHERRLNHQKVPCFT